MADIPSEEQQQIEEDHVHEAPPSRLGVFLWSVLPVDRWQLVFITGLVCLTVAPTLHWWPTGVPWNIEWYPYSVAPFYLIIAATALGYASLLWPLTRTARWLWLGICLPAGLGGGALIGRNFYLESFPHSIFDKSGWIASGAHQGLLAHAWGFGTGVHAWAIGILLVTMFAIRVSMGIAEAPLCLLEETGKLQRGPRILLWLVMGPQTILLLMSLHESACALACSGTGSGKGHVRTEGLRDIIAVAGELDDRWLS